MLFLKNEEKIKNSPIKFKVPGIPKFETVKKKKHTESNGIPTTIPL